MTNAETTKFEAGKTYGMQWITDADATTLITIIRRTDKSVWFAHPHTREIVRKAVKVELVDGQSVEEILPLGSYSMAPCLSADKRVQTRLEREKKFLQN